MVRAAWDLPTRSVAFVGTRARSRTCASTRPPRGSAVARTSASSTSAPRRSTCSTPRHGPIAGADALHVATRPSSVVRTKRRFWLSNMRAFQRGRGRLPRSAAATEAKQTSSSLSPGPCAGSSTSCPTNMLSDASSSCPSRNTRASVASPGNRSDRRAPGTAGRTILQRYHQSEWSSRSAVAATNRPAARSDEATVPGTCAGSHAGDSRARSAGPAAAPAETSAISQPWSGDRVSLDPDRTSAISRRTSRPGPAWRGPRPLPARRRAQRRGASCASPRARA